MTQRRKPLALFLTILLALSTVALSSSTNAEETSARTTGNEELTVSLPSSTKHIERGSSFAVTILATNLDPSSEYEVELSLCNVDWQNEPGEEIYTHTCSNIKHTFDIIDIGSGNSFTTVIETIDDPGYNNGANLYNETYLILGYLRIQGAPVTSNVTNAFVLGGEAYNWNVNGVSNVLLGSSLNLFGDVGFRTVDKYIDAYHVTCSIYADGSTTPITTVDGTSYGPSWQTNKYFDIVMPSPSTAGTHYLTCDLIRESNSQSMGTWTSDNIQVIDEDYTGNEHIEQNGVLPLHFERTDATNTVQMQVTFDIENLYVGTTYSLNGSYCSVDWQNEPGEEIYTHSCRDILDGFVNEFTVDFTPTSSTQSVTLTIDDPGYNNGANLYNETYLILGYLRIQGAPVTSNVTNAFVLGGEAYNWNVNGVSNVLLGSSLNLFGDVGFRTVDKYIDAYHVTCSIYADGSTTPITTVDGTSYGPSWQTNKYFDIVMPSPSTAGTHYLTCDLIRESNSQSMGTWTSDNIQVIDEDYTGNEHIEQNGVLPLHFERTDATNTVQMQVTFDIENLYVGTTYSLNGSYCSVDWQNEPGEEIYTHSCRDILDGFVNEFTVDFTPTSSTQSVTLTIDDPGYNNGANLYNETYLILGYLRIQGAPVTSNVTNAFVLGGEAYNWNVNGVSNVLLGSSLNLFGDVGFRTVDKYIDAYHVTCSIYADGSTTPITTVDGTSYGPSWQTNKYFDIVMPSPSTAGTHYLTCDLIRESNSQSMGTWTSDNIQVIDDTSNQDDATIVVGSTMNLQEAWGTVTIDAIDLDPGQEYTLDWVVEDHSLSPPTIMMQNDHIWVAGNDGTYTYELEFHDLADTTDACITVTFTAGDDELQVVDNVCWPSASTADGDGDGVYDKNDLCPDTTAGLAVSTDGCSDSDNDGFDTDLEIDCNTDPNNALSFPTDLDNDGICDYLDTDTDGDGYLDVDELAAGTDPLDPLSKPANRLPECAVYYNLEIDGIPTSFDGEAAIPALSGVTATTAAASLTPTTVTIPAGSYYITAHCIDPDGDDVTVTVNDITVGPVAGEVSGAVLIEIGEDVDETMDVQITWSDGTDSLTALVTVELDGGSPGLIPGFGTALTIMALLGAGFVLARKDD